MLRLRTLGTCAALAAGLIAAAPAAAETIPFTSALSPANQVPPVDSRATGSAELLYETETRMLTWMITYSGLSSPATAAHIHGPAAPGQNAPPIITMTVLQNPVVGTAALTEEQSEQLLGELWYFNFHTPAFPGGELRGQIIPIAQ